MKPSFTGKHVLEVGCRNCRDLLSYVVKADGFMVGWVSQFRTEQGHPEGAHFGTWWEGLALDGTPARGFTGFREIGVDVWFASRHLAGDALLDHYRKNTPLPDDGRIWWSVVADGTEQSFFAAPTGRAAVAQYRQHLVDQDRASGYSDTDARARVRRLNPQVAYGPFTTSGAFLLELGLTWADYANRRLVPSETLASRPIGRARALEALGEEETAQHEARVRAYYTK